MSKESQSHPYLEWKTDISDKAETVVIDYRFNEDGTRFGINQQNQVRLVALFRIGKRLYYTTLMVSKSALVIDSFLKNMIDKRMYGVACNAEKATQSS